MPNHTCPQCGTAFFHRKSARTYCSMDCRNATYKQRGPRQPGTRQLGSIPTNKVPVGTVTIRTRHKRGGERRAWVKVAEPNVWRERYRVVWEQAHGPAPRGMVIHHIDHDPLNDDIGNLMLMTRAEHASHHSGDVPDRFRTGTHAAPPNSDA